jgi:type IV conjugative transfer system coupling protein TraD
MSSFFTQGGQTQLHKIRMLQQVLGTTLKISFGITLLAFLLLALIGHTWQEFWLFLVYLKACFMHNCPKAFAEISPSSLVYFADGTSRWLSDVVIATAAYFEQATQLLVVSLLSKLLQASSIGIGGGLAISWFWVRSGKKRQQTNIIKGFELIESKQLAKKVCKIGKSPYSIAGVPIPKDSEFQHTMVTGTTGSGKSNMIHQLLSQIRENGDQAVIVDSTGGIFSRFYNSYSDVLLNPLDKRSVNWNLWKEAEMDFILEEIAESMIPDNGSYDSFWTIASRQLFCESVRFLISSNLTSYQELEKMIFCLPLKDLQEILKDTPAANLVDPSADKMAISIRATLGASLRFLKHLNDDKDSKEISLINFMREDYKKWVFLSCQPDQREILQPVFSAWISLIIKGIMRRPEKNNSKTWIILDELASLNKLPSLLTGLAELRKYGGCMVTGFQDLSQLEKIYEVSGTKTISNLTGTKVLFRAVDTDIATRVARYLGEQEKEEANESISFGAHQMRDGVNLSQQKRRQQLVSASEIMMLDNLQAYLKYPGLSQVTKINFDYVDFKLINSIQK